MRPPRRATRPPARQSVQQTKSAGYLVKTFLKHNVIFTEGSRGEHAYVLTQGRVEISGMVSGRKKVFAVLKPISIFGEMALFLDNQQRTATAMALEDCKVVVINKYDLDQFIHNSPPIVATIMNVLVHRLKTATQKALLCPNVPLGICRILDLFALNGVMDIVYEPAIRHMSDVFVATPAQIETYLGNLEAKGLLAVEEREGGARHIVIKQPKFMEAVLRQMRDEE